MTYLHSANIKESLDIPNTAENRLRVYLAALQGLAANEAHAKTNADIAKWARDITVQTFSSR